jgi:hypothetical protein
MQSRQQSVIEVICSTLAAFAISVAASSIIFPAFGFHSTHAQNLWITLIFTLISFIRSYLFRRFFNWLHSK